MLALSSLLVLAAGGVECFPPDTVTGQRQIRLGQCRDPNEPLPAPDRTPSASEQQRAKAAFDAIAFDGPSARWRFDVLRQGHLVCGYVNGKNQVGGFTGWTPFIFDLADGRFSTYRDRQWFYDAVCLGKPPPSP